MIGMSRKRKDYFTSTLITEEPRAEVRNGALVSLDQYRSSLNDFMQVETARGYGTPYITEGTPAPLPVTVSYPKPAGYWPGFENITKVQSEALGPQISAVPPRMGVSGYPTFGNTRGQIVGSQITSAKLAPPTRAPPAGTITLPHSRGYAGQTFYQEPPGISEAKSMVRARPAVRAPVPRRAGIIDWMKEPFWGLPKGAWVGLGSVAAVGTVVAVA